MSSPRIVNWDYDPKEDVLFVFSFKGYDYDKSVKINNILLDLDSHGMPVALEMSNASKFIGVKTKYLKKPLDFKIDLQMNKNYLIVLAYFLLQEKNKKIEKNLCQSLSYTGFHGKNNTLTPFYLE